MKKEAEDEEGLGMQKCGRIERTRLSPSSRLLTCEGGMYV